MSQAYRVNESFVNVEAAHGVTSTAHQAALNKFVAGTDVSPHVVERTTVDDSGKLNGQRGKTSVRTIRKSGKGTLTRRLSARALASWLMPLLQNITSGAASVGTSEVQRQAKTGTITAGGRTFTFRGATTTELAFDASDAAIQAALEALPTVGAGNVTVLTTGNNTDITFAGTLADLPVPAIELTVTTPIVGGGSWAMSTVTPGVAPNLFAHVVQSPDACVKAPKTKEMVEGEVCGAATGTKRLLKAAVPFTITIDLSGDEGSLSIEYGTDGTETVVSTFNFNSTESAVEELFGNSFSVWLGADSTALLSDDGVVSLKITITGNIQAKSRRTKRTEVVGWQFTGDGPTIGIELVIEGNKASTTYQRWEAGEFGTTFYFKTLIEPTYAGATGQTIQLVCSACMANAPFSYEEEDGRLTVTLDPLTNATDGNGPGTFTLVTPDAVYNVPL